MLIGLHQTANVKNEKFLDKKNIKNMSYISYTKHLNPPHEQRRKIEFVQNHPDVYGLFISEVPWMDCRFSGFRDWWKQVSRLVPFFGAYILHGSRNLFDCEKGFLKHTY